MIKMETPKFIKVKPIEDISNKEEIKNYESKDENLNSKDFFYTWVDSFTMHAIPNIFRTKHSFIKLMWILCFLTSSGLCAFTVYQNINNYFQFNVVTTTRLHREIPMIFPTITICNYNAFVTKYSYAYVKQTLSLFNITDLTNSTMLSVLIPSVYNTTKNYYAARLILLEIAKSQKIDEQTKKLFGYSFDKFFISCFYGSLECNKDDFVSIYDTYHGNCFRFNSGKYENGTSAKLKTTSKIGKYDGLALELFVGDGEDPATLAMGAGAHIFVHNNTLTPISHEGVDLNTGTTTNIVVSKVYRSKMPYPYSECQSGLDDPNGYDSILFKKIIESNNSYRQSDCIDLCLQKEIFKACNCYDTTYMMIEPNSRPCIALNETLCIYETLTIFRSKHFEEVCPNECPAECSSISYGYSTSFSQYPAKPYGNLLLQDSKIVDRFDDPTTASYDKLKENILAVNIYFDSLESTEIYESEQTLLVDLIAGIGGTLGLFLGVSMLSFFEIFEIFLEMAFLKFYKKNKVKQIK